MSSYYSREREFVKIDKDKTVKHLKSQIQSLTTTISELEGTIERQKVELVRQCHAITKYKCIENNLNTLRQALKTLGYGL